jgi:CPSF A subunit region
METFIAVGIGVLVTEDWSSQGSVQLFRVHRERTQGFDGAYALHWALAPAHRREFTGPVTALTTSGGNLVVAFGHNVRPIPLQ